jgi:hypothetical protein
MELMVSVDLARSCFGLSSGSIDGLHSFGNVSSVPVLFPVLLALHFAQPESDQQINSGGEQLPGKGRIVVKSR